MFDTGDGHRKSGGTRSSLYFPSFEACTTALLATETRLGARLAPCVNSGAGVWSGGFWARWVAQIELKTGKLNVHAMHGALVK